MGTPQRGGLQRRGVSCLVQPGREWSRVLIGRVRFIIIAVVWVATLTAVLFWALGREEGRLSIAAGPRSSESFELGTAIAEVFSSQQGNPLVDVFETAGSTENVKLLERGEVDFALVQADSTVHGGVAAVASLYEDAYQLIVNEDSGIESFSDLPGHRIAIPPSSSGQNRSFWFLAEHYGFAADELTALPMSEDAANFAMIQGQVDAVFRVRAPGNPSIRQLIGNHSMRLVPIEQSEALSLRRPAIAPGLIPKGSYRGHPALPATDMRTAAVERMLAARSDLAPEIVSEMTRVLFERRSDLVALTNLAGFIESPVGHASNSMPLHPGARSFYDREKPTFLQQNARMGSALIYAVAIIFSGALALRTRWVQRRRIRMGDYNRELMRIATVARGSESPQELIGLKDRLVDMLRQLVEDLDSERVSQDEFEHFSFTWQAVDTLVRDHLSLAREASLAERISESTAMGEAQ